MKLALIVAAAVVLVLIANFVVFRGHLRKVQELPVALPPVPPTQAEAIIQVVVLSSDSCTLDGLVIETSSLKDRLVAAKVEGKFSVSIKAARGVSYEALVPVLDLVRQASIEQISIETTQP